VEQATPQNLAKSNIVGLLSFGAFQGAAVAFAIVLLNRHDSGHCGSHIFGRFIINIGLLAVGTLATKKLFPGYLTQPPRSPVQARIATVAFLTLMLGLAFVLWKMLTGACGTNHC
jgi:hypothetical protein